MSEGITQFLRLLEFLHQRLDTGHITTHLSHLGLEFLESVLDDIHTQIEHQMEHMLAKASLALLQLEALAQLMGIDGQSCGQTADIHIGMVHEIGLGLEIGLATMRYSLLEDLIIKIVVEMNIILSQIEIHILGHRQVGKGAIIHLDMFEDDSLAIADNALNQKGFHF